jgi:hypothetical protein
VKVLYSFVLVFFCTAVVLHGQTESWEKHKFKNYRLEFQTPPHWHVTVKDSSEKSYIECLSQDNQIYFFLTVAENEKKSTNEIVLSYLKITYGNAEFIREEQKKINNIDFIFASGIAKLDELQTFIKLGVGNHKRFIYMIDSGYSQVNSDEADRLLNDIIESVKAID